MICGLEGSALKQATRFDLGVLRSDAAAKMAGIKNLL